MTLHCLNRAADSAAAQRLLAQLHANDLVLLLGPAVRLAASGHPRIADWLAASARLYALDADLRAHGVTTIDPAISVVDYAGWVRLSEAQDTQLLWR